jgi:DNA-binding CsgD family transcriptional regulator
MLHKAPDPEQGTSLRNRRIAARDTTEVAQWMIDDLPVPLPLAAELARILYDLVKEERIYGVCVEEAIASRPWRGNCNRRIVAFGMSTFLSDACLKAQIAAPRANFAIELLNRVVANPGAAGLLSLPEVAQGNAGEGLNLFPFLWLQRPRDPASPEGARLMTRAMYTLLEEHKGFNLKCIVKEGGREQEEAFTRGGMKKLAPCASEAGAPEGERFWFGLTREEARGDAFGTGLSLLFHHDHPRCGFTRIQQHVLQCASDDMNDVEIADHLGVTPHAVNMRWRTIYERIERQADLVALVFNDRERIESNGRASDGGGVHKRRRVVAYVRAHPEELRPYASR